jgi:hypothetical protein
MPISPNRLKELQAIPDTEIDTSDIPELDEHFWEKALMVKPDGQKAVLVNLDQDILDWFKNQKKDHQYLINAAIRAYIKHESLSDFS